MLNGVVLTGSEVTMPERRVEDAALGSPAAVAGRGRASTGRWSGSDVGLQGASSTDSAAATEMQAAKRKLFASFPQRRSA